MRDFIVSRSFSIRVVSGFFLVTVLTVAWAGVAYAQSADDQYGTPVSPSGPAAGEPVTVLGDTDGVVNEGDTMVIEGDYVIADGASLTVQDSGGTQGTLIDGQNAEIIEGSIRAMVTGPPIITVAGGSGVLDTVGLFVVATTGIAAADDDDAGSNGEDDVVGGAVAETGNASASGGSEAKPASAIAGVLPDTGGPVLFGVLGGAALLGGGLLAIRRRLPGSE